MGRSRSEAVGGERGIDGTSRPQPVPSSGRANTLMKTTVLCAITSRFRKFPRKRSSRRRARSTCEFDARCLDLSSRPRDGGPKGGREIGNEGRRKREAKRWSEKAERRGEKKCDVREKVTLGGLVSTRPVRVPRYLMSHNDP